MSFIDDILKYKSVSIAGLEKNTGKTETLNYIINNLKDRNKTVALTSIGVDGESIDSVTNTHKPDITVYENMLFVTSEKHYRERRVTSEIVDVSDISTSLGRLVVARAKDTGKIKLSGPADTGSLKNIISHLSTFGAEITIVDGALSRLSLASPTVTDALVLATGAALSANISELVRKTKYVYDLTQLPAVSKSLKDVLSPISSGIKALKSLTSKSEDVIDLGIDSVFSLNGTQNIFKHGKIIYIPGAVSDKVLSMFKTQKNIDKSIIIINDFTKVFAKAETFYSFIKQQGKIMVLNKPNLIAITINPLSPAGYMLNSKDLKHELTKQIDVAIHNIKQTNI